MAKRNTDLDPAIYECARGHLSTSDPGRPVGMEPDEAYCSRCFTEWLRDMFAIAPTKSAEVEAAYRMGGLKAAQQVAEALERQREVARRLSSSEQAKVVVNRITKGKGDPLLEEIAAKIIRAKK